MAMTLIPHRLFLEITTECNLRCKLCKLWEQKDELCNSQLDKEGFK